MPFGKTVRQTLSLLEDRRYQPPVWEKMQDKFSTLQNYSTSVVHEAAHALIGWRALTTGLVVKMSVEPSFFRNGYCLVILPEPISEPACWQNIEMILAGVVAERLVWPDDNPSGYETDIDEAFELIERIKRRTEPPWLDDTSIVVPDIVWEHELCWIRDRDLEILDICYRRAMYELAINYPLFLQLCRRLNERQTLYLPELLILLGPLPLAARVATGLATAIDLLNEIRRS
ncbi:MAG: hypothetical protein V1738_01995 [Patescibacteria group bacterium]